MYIKRIRDLREDADLTQKELSEYLNISQRTYSRYENDQRNIPTEILIKLADYYDITLDYLCERIDKKTSFEKQLKQYLKMLENKK